MRFDPVVVNRLLIPVPLGPGGFCSACDATSGYYDFPARLYHRVEYPDSHRLCLSGVWRPGYSRHFRFKFVILTLGTSPRPALRLLSDQSSSSGLSDLLFEFLFISSVVRDLFGVFISHLVVNELVPGRYLEIDCPCGAHKKTILYLKKTYQ